VEQLIGAGLRKEYNRAVCCHRLLKLYTEHIMRNARLDDLQAEIKIGGEKKRRERENFPTKSSNLRHCWPSHKTMD